MNEETLPVNESSLPRISSLIELPDEILNKIIDYLCTDQVTPRSNNSKSLIGFPKYTYILNHIRIGSLYHDILALSSTCTYFRKRLAPILFQSLSLVRTNQVDAVLESPKSQQLFSDTKTIQQHFMKELIVNNIEQCERAATTWTSFQTNTFDDKMFKSRYGKYLMMTRFVNYLECDNSFLNGEGIRLFSNLTALKVLDIGEGAVFMSNFELANLRYLAINAQTLIYSPQFLRIVPKLNRLDLFLDYGNLPSLVGIRPLIQQFRAFSQLTELVLLLNNPFTIAYLDTIKLLETISKNASNFAKLTIRYIRRNNESTVDQSGWELYQGRIGGKLLKVFKNLTDLIIDISILDLIKFDPETYSSPVLYTDHLMEKRITLVDEVVVGPNIDSTTREIAGVIIRHCQFTHLFFQYGESIEESHLHVLKLLTDFVGWLSNGHLDQSRTYLGIRQISLEKCWSMTDDSLLRDMIGSSIKSKSESDLSALQKVYPWTTTINNSPRYKDIDSYNINYVEEAGLSITDSRGYFIGVSDQDADRPQFTTVDKKSGIQTINMEFWSGESSLLDFEQYSIRQRRSLLWG
ncbi:Hap43p-repressed protein [Candida albicans P78042]|nr:Hap43p-repressed protein [Candida albicans P78042]